LSPKRTPTLLALIIVLLYGDFSLPRISAQTPPVVVEVNIDGMIHHVSADFVIRGIRYANQRNADAVLLVLDTPGGLMNSMRSIIQAILDSRVPVITYVAPSGGSAASAGFFVLLAGDVAAMAPGTTSGAAHPVILGGTELGKTVLTKIENDAASYIRSIADKRGRNAKLAEEGVRESKSYTDREALEGHLIDFVANTPQDLFAKLHGKTIKRFNDTTTTLRLAGAVLEPFRMTRTERFFAWVADPNIAFILGAIGVACLYFEFTHPGVVAPGVVGALALVLALYAFNLLPINIMGVLLIALALALFVLEAKVTSHGVLAVGGLIAMVLGAMMLVNSPWPEARIHLSTALSVALPLALITVILLRFAIAAKLRKVVTGEAGMIGSVGVTRTDLEPVGQVLVHGELWEARARQKIPKGTRVRVLAIEGLILLVESVSESQ
jgi:membrane-bound serine protease (ClpP class)